MKKICPNCAQFIDRKVEICPFCGKPVKTDRVNIPKSDRNVSVKLNKSSKDKKKSKIIVTENPLYGTINISTKDSIYYNSPEYTAKIAHGDYEQEKLKWWEIYKWADRTLTRRKINKVVNANANKTPDSRTYVGMLILTLLMGYTGLNHIYAKNYKRGISMGIMFVISILVVGLVEKLTFLKYVQMSIGAGFGLVVAIMWIFDLFRVIFRKYIYKSEKIDYIKMLDIETRVKLGKKYIDMENFGKRVKKTKLNKDETTEKEDIVA